MQRTPYNAALWCNQFKRSISPSETMMKEGYIVVYQDVRGRWMSDGLYDNMRAFIPNKKLRKILMKHQILTTQLIG
jgi:predicted acyl esterase